MIRVALLSDLPPGTVRRVPLAGGWIALANTGGAVYAFEDRCLHWGIRLSQGTLDGARLTCRLHAWTYDLTEGVVISADDESAVGSCITTFPVRVVGGEIQVQPTPRRGAYHAGAQPHACSAPNDWAPSRFGTRSRTCAIQSIDPKESHQ